MIYAVNVAIVSGMEVVLFSRAQNHDLLQKKLPRDVYRYGAAMSLAPVLFFIVSIPIAFVSTTLAVCSGSSASRLPPSPSAGSPRAQTSSSPVSARSYSPNRRDTLSR